jgi:phospholipid/cholesterol/gamma-HCH transport system substrate-binding protein
MNKNPPSIARIAAMVAFTLSVAALLMFLWTAFGGTLPLKPESYRFKAEFPEASLLVKEADVRMAGVNIGKVKQKELGEGGRTTLVEIELDSRFAPIGRDARAILRQKSLLGETYVEITPGSPEGPELGDGDTLARSNVDDTVELDEVFRVFDEETREGFQQWLHEAGIVTSGTFARDFNDSLGNAAPFFEGGADLLRPLAEHEVALAETFQVFPTFLRETRFTVRRLEDFARNTDPLVRDLAEPARDLAPTLRDLGDLSPDLEKLFRDIDPLVRASRRGVPAAERFLEGAEPVLEATHQFMPELNPILSYLSFARGQLAQFITVGGAALAGNGEGGYMGRPGVEHYLPQIAIIDGRSFQRRPDRPSWERANSYVAPNAYDRAIPLGVIESFDCRANGGEQRNPEGEGEEAQPPCYEAPPLLWSGEKYPRLRRGRAPLVDAPQGREGSSPANP